MTENETGEHTCPDVEHCPYCLLDACEELVRTWYDLRFTPERFRAMAIDLLCGDSDALLRRLAAACRARTP